ncbi:hypothetical protein RHMOL_Rhmol13G0289100 [Rhododendron molle]|uniref:Uncharacterized protein n=1 Tax=Rhododendron molle TaxID=49168 RepID=A0ACC0LBU4_RHOML|nr:hypothetical protein RHMOL_Rhmol13G0289100 [Rhododendron molle]
MIGIGAQNLLKSSLHGLAILTVCRLWKRLVGYKDQGWVAFKIHKKLKSIKFALKNWAIEDFGDLQNKLDRIELEMHDLALTCRLRMEA